MSRIAAKFEKAARERRIVVSIFLTVGHPSLTESRELALAATEGGAEIIELGVPFSDPLADGATIQASSQKALEAGVTVSDCIQTAASLRASTNAAVLLMGYANPFIAYGLERLARDAAAAGVDGLIVPDLPPEEAEEFERALEGSGIDLIFLVAPTSDDGRLKIVAAHARGFIYCVSLTGITGERDRLDAGVESLLGRVRKHTQLPLAVGFGISRPEHVAALRGRADAAIIGSAFVRLAEETAADRRGQAAREFVAAMVEAASGT